MGDEEVAGTSCPTLNMTLLLHSGAHSSGDYRHKIELAKSAGDGGAHEAHP